MAEPWNGFLGRLDVMDLIAEPVLLGLAHEALQDFVVRLPDLAESLELGPRPPVQGNCGSAHLV